MKKIFLSLTIIAIIVIAFLSILLVLNLVSSPEIKDAVIKSLIVLGIIGVASFLISFISKK